jgi:hypothetical protein
LSKWRQLMATLMAIPTFSANHLEVESFDYGERLICQHTGWYLTLLIPWSPHMALFVLYFIVCCFCKGLEMSDGEWQDSHSFTYLHTCSALMSSLPLYRLLEEYKWELSKDTFLVLSSHNFTPKRNELRYHCCLWQLYFIGH